MAPLGWRWPVWPVAVARLESALEVPRVGTVRHVLVDQKAVRQEEGGQETEESEPTWYEPLEESDLPTALRVVADEGTEPGRIDVAARFASRYGLLGFSELAGKDAPVQGEPLEWVVAQASTVKLVMDLQERLQRIQSARVEHSAAQDELEAYLTPALSGKVTRRGHRVGGIRVAEGPAIVTVRFPGWLKTAEDRARWLIARLVTNNVAGVRRRLAYEGPAAKPYFAPRALVEAVWWILADAIEGGQFRRCKDCRNPFIAHDPRHEFCPNPFAGGKGWAPSPCAKRYHQRKVDQDKARAVRLLREGLTPQEVAARVGRPTATVERWAAKARKEEHERG